MTNKKMIISAMLAVCTLTSSFIAPFIEDSPFSVTASAATTSQIAQLQSDLTTISNHIKSISYLQKYKKSNTYTVIAAYQRTLNTLYGAGLSVDGIFGPACETATKNIQRNAGITSDGICGVGTLNIIKAKANSYISANTSASISYSSMTVPSSITKGNSFNLSGYVNSSGAVISSFKGEILSGNRVLQSYTVYPKTYSVKINSSAVNTYLKFGNLGAGTYTLRYTAVAGSTTKTYSSTFTVKAKKAVISFNSMSAPSNIKQGNSYSLRGTITSAYCPIYSIKAEVRNSNNATVLSKTVYPGSYSYSIPYSALDNALTFGKISGGSYNLVYTVTATDGTTTSKTYPFTVQPTTPTITVNSNKGNGLKLDLALEYAKQYWNKLDPANGFYTSSGTLTYDPSKFSTSGNNCANYVSSILYNAGLPMDSTWTRHSYAWVNVNGLKSYFKNKGVQYISYPSSTQIEAGDVIYTSSGHVMFVTSATWSGSKKVITATGNTNNRNINYRVTSFYGVLKTSSLFN